MNNTPWLWQLPQWPHFHWDKGLVDEAIISTDYARGELIAIGKGLDQRLSYQAMLAILLDQAISSSEIEGDPVNRENLRKSLARRLDLPFLGGRPNDQKAEGIADVMLQTCNADIFPITVKTLHGWHRAFFPTPYSGLRKIAVGDYRNCPADITDASEIKVYYAAPQAEQLEQEMNDFICWFNDPPESIHPLIYSAITHLWFVAIHPYEDGNGRLSRALADLALTRFEKARLYATAPVMAMKNSGYYEALQKTNHTLDITCWIVNYVHCVRQAIKQSRSIISQTLKIDRFWKIVADKGLNGRQIKVVKKLLDAEPGQFTGGLGNKKYCAISGCSNKTASEDLKILERFGVLIKLPGKGRSTAFDIAWDAL